jgi:hypothetical protein
VGRIISDVGDGGTPVYRRERQENFRPKSVNMIWIWEVFDFVIGIGSEQDRGLAMERKKFQV